MCTVLKKFLNYDGYSSNANLHVYRVIDDDNDYILLLLSRSRLLVVINTRL